MNSQKIFKFLILHSLKQVLILGCYLNQLPYKWNGKAQQLLPGSKPVVALFHLQFCIYLLYMSHGWFRLLQSYQRHEFSYISYLMAYTTITTFAGLLILVWFPKEVMQFANRLLKSFTKNQKSVSNDFENSIEYASQKKLCQHMTTNIFLLYFNPLLHISTVDQDICNPSFISASFLPCESEKDAKSIPPGQKLPFLICEFYMICRWQYIKCFQWAVVYTTLALILLKLKKLKELTNRPSLFVSKSSYILQTLRSCQLLVTTLNKIFHLYFLTLPAIGTAVFATLIFGAIRRFNIMYPICALQCAMEAILPQAIAGEVNYTSDYVLKNWKQNLKLQIAEKMVKRETINGNPPKFQLLQIKSCRGLNCSSGSLYLFKRNTNLEYSNDLINQATNLLISFPAKGY